MSVVLNLRRGFSGRFLFQRCISAQTSGPDPAETNSRLEILGREISKNFSKASSLTDSFCSVILLQVAVDHVVPSYKTGHILRHGCLVWIRLFGFRISTDAK
jgi:hypothetical protein